jgi:hypothetical protein
MAGPACARPSNKPTPFRPASILPRVAPVRGLPASSACLVPGPGADRGMRALRHARVATIASIDGGHVQPGQGLPAVQHARACSRASTPVRLPARSASQDVSRRERVHPCIGHPHSARMNAFGKRGGDGAPAWKSPIAGMPACDAGSPPAPPPIRARGAFRAFRRRVSNCCVDRRRDIAGSVPRVFAATHQGRRSGCGSCKPRPGWLAAERKFLAQFGAIGLVQRRNADIAGTPADSLRTPCRRCAGDGSTALRMHRLQRTRNCVIEKNSLICAVSCACNSRCALAGMRMREVAVLQSPKAPGPAATGGEKKMPRGC